MNDGRAPKLPPISRLMSDRHGAQTDRLRSHSADNRQTGRLIGLFWMEGRYFLIMLVLSITTE